MVIRHDDYDFRLTPQQYINIHEEFIKTGLTETANMQFTQWGRISPIPDELINYIRTSPNYDIQIHGWGHFHYDEEEYDFIVRDLFACIHACQKYFNATPTVWYPPWNCMSNNMERAALVAGLKIDNESYDIAKFIREAEVDKFSGHSVYFHGWKADEMLQFPKMMELSKKYENHS